MSFLITLLSNLESIYSCYDISYISSIIAYLESAFKNFYSNADKLIKWFMFK